MILYSRLGIYIRPQRNLLLYISQIRNFSSDSFLLWDSFLEQLSTWIMDAAQQD